MYWFYDNNDLFHWLTTTGSCAINQTSYNFFNYDR